ncbi:MAG: exonuclease SbcCD subunit D [Anaerolineaceae bacterium]|nr:exonuclease SbcCD subunit D [Anaerolineaceae bacterium]
MTKLRILHFADAHIDIAVHGRRDPQTGLPVRVMDFLKSLDTIVNTAIEEKVDLVLFAGDAYKDRSPAPTFQREWGRRIMRLSEAGVPTLLLVGNHDISPAVGRATALQEYDTLQVPHIHLINQPSFLKPAELESLPLQVLALPWVSRSSLMGAFQLSGKDIAAVFGALESRLGELMETWMANIQPDLPVILAAHASVQGAMYGAERSVMLGGDLVLPLGLVTDPRLSYVALGHIHKAQDLNKDRQPPVVYPGSIERVDFGEAADDKFFVIAHIEKGSPTQVEWRKLSGRRFIDRKVQITSGETFMNEALAALPSPQDMQDAFVRLIIEYPRSMDAALDEAVLRQYAEPAFELHLVRRPLLEARLRLPNDQTINSLAPIELLALYWKTINTSAKETEVLQKLAVEVLLEDEAGGGNKQDA